MRLPPSSCTPHRSDCESRSRGSLLLLFFALLCGPLTAQVVNFNFMEDYNSTNVNFGQGAVDDPGNNFWNRVGQTPGSHPANGADFYASDGTTPTTIRIAFDSPNSFGTGDTPLFAADLFQGYFVAGASPAGFTITGLTAGQSYDFYFYSESGAQSEDRAGLFTFNGDSLPVTSTFQSSFIEGVNYVVFSVTPSGTRLSGTLVCTTARGETDFAGMQVVATTSAIPEPSTYAALCGAVAMAGVLVFRRRTAADTAG